MHTLQFEIVKPTGDADFEDMCALVYGELFDDPTPQKNGRRGQSQAGVDVFVKSAKHGRVGIQCKRYADGKLTLKLVQAEVDAADKGKVAINRLVIATTAANDAKLIQAVQLLSDSREAAGKFPIQVDGWSDISRHISTHSRLQHHYAPNAPGAAFYSMQQDQKVLLEKIQGLSTTVNTLAVSLPASRPDSTNLYITAQLDAVNELLKSCKFFDAAGALVRIGSDLSLFDQHQQARWYLQRANCSWHQGRKDNAAADFLRAAELYPDDEKMAAAGVRGLLLQEKIEAALERAKEALQRHPASLPVWLVYANATMLSGGKLRIGDAPTPLRHEPDVLQTVAWARFRQGDLVGAVTLSLRGAKAEGAGFFTRAAALGFALQKAAGTAAAVAFNSVAKGDRDILQTVVAEFDDRANRLWDVQARLAVDDAASQLALAFIVLGRVDDALSVANEARVRGVLTGRLLRTEMEALRRQRQHLEAIRRGTENLQLLEADGLALLAELAAHQGDVDLVMQIQARAVEFAGDDAKLRDALVAIRWLALWHNAKQAEAIKEVFAADLTQSSSMTLVCAGARILIWAERMVDADPLVDNAMNLCADKPSEEQQLLLAELLFAAGRFGQAADAYARFVKPNLHTELHNRLLCCYVRTGARQKAKALLENLPDGWTEDEETRGLAIELGQRAGDFAMLEQLAKVQVRSAPDRVSSWTFRMSVALRTLSGSNLTTLIGETPEGLHGDQRQIAQLASLELKFGDKAKAMRRLYRMYRQDVDSPDAASAYFIPIVSVTNDLPNMEAELDSVAAGTTVTLTDALGATVVVPIDPLDVAFPPSSKFFNVEAAEVKPLLGARAGDEVFIPGTFGQVRTFRVVKIKSTYRHLSDHAHGVIASAVKSVDHVMSVPIPMKDGHADFSFVHAQLKQNTEHGKMVLQAYADSPLTIGLCGDMLGKNALEMVSGWPGNGPALEVCGGTVDEVQSAEALLANPTASYVVDTATLAELAGLNCLAALGALPRVFVSTTTRDIVLNALAEAKDERSSGQAVDDEGEMRYVPLTDEDKARRVAYLQSIADAIEAHCEVAPAYGPAEPAIDLVKTEELLQPDEHAALMLAAERDAVLFSLDWRLRRLALSCGVRGIWVQPVLLFAARADKLAPIDYSLSNIKQLLRNRSFVALNAWDLVAMCLQGGFWLQVGMRRVKEFIASTTTDQMAVIGVVQEFLRAQASLLTSWSALGELLSHLSEAIFRRTDVSPAAEAALLEQVHELVRVAVGPVHLYGTVSTIQRLRSQRFLDLLTSKVREGLAASKSGNAIRPVHVKALYCTRVPTLVYATVESEPMNSGDSVTNAASPADSGDPEQSKALLLHRRALGEVTSPIEVNPSTAQVIALRLPPSALGDAAAGK